MKHYSQIMVCCFASMMAFSLHAATDFDALESHWNFDEARDWHQESFPFSRPVRIAYDLIGGYTLSLVGLDPVTAWVSGQQFAGVAFTAPKQFLKARRPLPLLAQTATLAFWMRVDDARAAIGGGVAGDVRGVAWGVVLPSGALAIQDKGKTVVSTAKPVTDGAWHWIVMRRDAATGAVSISMDAGAPVTGRGSTGVAAGDYMGFGAIQGGGTWRGRLDQIYLFSTVIRSETEKTLMTNFAPKVYAHDNLVSRNQPSRTSSVLLCDTFDPDQDVLRVSRFGQGRHGRVTMYKDGSFQYEPGAGFDGRDRFGVVVTDGRGGYGMATISVHDAREMAQSPTTRYTAYQAMPAEGMRGNSRQPLAFDWTGDGKLDVLVCDGSQVWAYEGAKRGAAVFDAPVAVETADGEGLEATAIAAWQPGRAAAQLVVRTSSGELHVYDCVKPVSGRPRMKKHGVIANAAGGAFTTPSRAIAIGPFRNNALPELLVGVSNGINRHRMIGTAERPAFADESDHVIDGSYNFAPYFADLNGDGRMDLLRGNNWGSVHYWINAGGQTILEGAKQGDLTITDADGTPATTAEGKPALRTMNGTYGAFADYTRDGTLDFVIGGHTAGLLAVATGVPIDAASKNLQAIEALYRGHEKALGPYFEENDQAALKRYRALMHAWIEWAVQQREPSGVARAYAALKRHVRKYPFLRYGATRDTAGVTRSKDNKTVVNVGAMHHVPGIVVMNWIVLHNLGPDTLEHRRDVADTIGLPEGTLREIYMATGLVVAENARCSEAQLLAVRDFMRYHPRHLFPDDHLSIDQIMGDGRDAMCYVFRSNKNTFGSAAGALACEAAGDIVRAAEKCLGPGAAKGDYFTLVMGHEVCHSLDAYVYGLGNADYRRRWNDMIVFAGNNGGAVDLIGARPGDGAVDMNETQNRFRAKGLWDGSGDLWKTTWEQYWKTCGYNDLSFMRGNTGWFLTTKQETFATQANHHWAGSEARLVGAVDRFNRGYRANINEVVFFLDVLSCGLNILPMYRFTVSKDPARVNFHVEKAILTRDDNGRIVRIVIGPRVYAFTLDAGGRVTGITQHPFVAELGK